MSKLKILTLIAFLIEFLVVNFFIISLFPEMAIYIILFMFFYFLGIIILALEEYGILR